MQDFQVATVQMVVAIDQAAASMHAMFTATAESIRMDVMSPEERYAYLQSQTDALYEQLMTSTDPAEIQRLAERINSNITSAWGMLDEGQQSALADAYIERLETLDQVVADKMQALRDVVIEDAEDVMGSIADRLDVLFASASTTAETNRVAAETMLVAARTPQAVAVVVNDNSVNGG
jgi:hypothetical protein